MARFSNLESPRYKPFLRTIAWLGLSAAQIIDFILVHNLVMKLTQLWYDGAVTRLLAADPRNSTVYLDFRVKMIYFITMLVLGIIAVTVAIFMEHYFAVGERKKVLGRRVLKVAAIEAGIAVFAVLVVIVLNLLG